MSGDLGFFSNGDGMCGALMVLTISAWVLFVEMTESSRLLSIYLFRVRPLYSSLLVR